MSTNPRAAAQADLDDLRAMNAQFIANFVANDVAAHDAILHPRFVYINGEGARIDRATYLRNWATGFDPAVIVYWDVRDEMITLAGDTALVRAANKCVERIGGRDVESTSVYTDVYVREAGNWRCLQAQITPIPPGKGPSDDTVVSVWLKGVLQTA